MYCKLHWCTSIAVAQANLTHQCVQRPLISTTATGEVDDIAYDRAPVVMGSVFATADINEGGFLAFSSYGNGVVVVDKSRELECC